MRPDGAGRVQSCLIRCTAVAHKAQCERSIAAYQRLLTLIRDRYQSGVGNARALAEHFRKWKPGRPR